MKLIPMTDFCLQEQKGGQQVNSITSQLHHELRSIKKYANFLKQPLKKGMFVPCDEFDNILEEPLQEHYTDCTEEQNAKDWLYNLEKYNEAKERVLFKGFKVRDYKHGSLYSKTITDETGLIHLFWFDKITETWYLSHDLKTVEHLTILKCLELTETSLKEIGL